MDLGSIFIIFALLILVGLFISRPFLDKKYTEDDRSSNSEEHELSALMADRDQVLNALQELDFDAALGKIPKEDYPVQRAALMQHGADVLRKLDQLQEGEVSESVDETDTRLEAAIIARRADLGPVAPSVEVNGNEKSNQPPSITYDDELETLLAKRRRERQGKSAGFCPQCGGSVQKVDRFCPKCGAKLV